MEASQNRGAAWPLVIVVLVLCATNFITWRDLQAERGLRAVAEQRVKQANTAVESGRSHVGWFDWRSFAPGVAGSSRSLGTAAVAKSTSASTAPDVPHFNSAVPKARVARQLADPAAHEALREQQ